MLARVWEKEDSRSLWVGLASGMAILEITAENSPKTKNRSTV